MTYSLDWPLIYWLREKIVAGPLMHRKLNIWYVVSFLINKNSNKIHIDKWIWSGIYLWIHMQWYKICRCIHTLTFCLFHPQFLNNSVYKSFLSYSNFTTCAVLKYVNTEKPVFVYLSVKSKTLIPERIDVIIDQFSFDKCIKISPTHDITITQLLMNRQGSISDCLISHASRLSHKYLNKFLGLWLSPYWELFIL